MNINISVPSGIDSRPNAPRQPQINFSDDKADKGKLMSHNHPQSFKEIHEYLGFGNFFKFHNVFLLS